jgi:hypothetical protein
LQLKRGPALKFGVTQLKEILVLQLARVRIQTALLLFCVWCAEAFKTLIININESGKIYNALHQFMDAKRMYVICNVIKVENRPEKSHRFVELDVLLTVYLHIYDRMLRT